jgi:hypothetical protein
MAGSSRAVDLAYRKKFRIMEDRGRSCSRSNMRKPIRLRESDELKSYSQMLTAAITFFEGKEDESVSLPADSPEKLTIEAVMGVLNQYRIADGASNDVIRENAKMLSDKLRNMFQDRSSQTSPIIEYINKLRENMLALHNSISPGREPSAQGEPPNEPNEPKPEEGDEEAEEPPAAGGEAEGDDLAKQLGLS